MNDHLRTAEPATTGIATATQTHYTSFMKSAAIPQVRVEPELRTQLEAVLRPEETLSEFVEAAVRGALEQRVAQTEFHARGDAEWATWQRERNDFSAGKVIEELRAKLEMRRAVLLNRGHG
jgi:hypothetical protein